MNNKHGVILNYGLMVGEIESVMRDSTNFMHRFFVNDPALATDSDLLEIAGRFANLCYALKSLDETINKIGKNQEKQNGKADSSIQD